MISPADNKFKNPILSGFYPDPSICRVGDDFYLVTSTFAYFPGVPIFHSRDLVHWKQIGHVLDRPSQLNLDGVGTSEGIFAPTIRHHDGVFYMITTNISKGGNFYVTATDPAGPWSDPIWITQAPGIDPTIFFDGGKAWYLGTRPAPEGEKYSGNWEVWIQELELGSGKLLGESVGLWRGALRDVIWPEGPHLYKKDGWYYLMIAEGGTGINHAVSMARSTSLTGPYIGNPNNPILTHRHLGADYPVTHVGHADIVDTAAGEWWMICLATRPCGGQYRNIGRETFLLPVRWDDGWLVAAPGIGQIEAIATKPSLPSTPIASIPVCDHFDSPVPALYWTTLRTPDSDFWSLTQRPGWLSLRLRPVSLREKLVPSVLFRRMCHQNCNIFTLLDFAPAIDGESAGLVLRQNEDFQFIFERTMLSGRQVLRIVAIENGKESELASIPCASMVMQLGVQSSGQELSFRWALPGGNWTSLIEHVDSRLLSTERAGGFVGTMIGMFASSNGKTSERYAAFDWFEYSGENS